MCFLLVSFFKCITECCRYLLRAEGLDAFLWKQLSFAVRAEMLELAIRDLALCRARAERGVQRVLHDESDLPMCRLAARQTAHAAIKLTDLAKMSAVSQRASGSIQPC